MRLIVLSHKETWPDSASPSGFATVGGFPFQMQAISELFDQTTLMVPVCVTPLPDGTRPLTGHNLCVHPLREPVGTNLRRKISLFFWLPRYLPYIWNEISHANAVHTPVPGDIGGIGILAALVQRKPLFVRHCGTWGDRSTFFNAVLAWLLPRIAGGRNVVLATGGGVAPPELGHPDIHWVFSTTLTQAEWEIMPQAQLSPTLVGGSSGVVSLHLVTVGRLSPDKNLTAAIQALARLHALGLEVTLDVVGSGEMLASLQHLAAELGLQERVIFHGNVPHARVLEVLSTAHLFVFPTRTKEGFPKALLEALACGLPAVATRVSVIPHLLGEGTPSNCGCVLDDPTPEALAAAIQKMLADPSLLAEMGIRARQVSAAYTLEAWRDAISAHLTAAWGPLKNLQIAN